MTGQPRNRISRIGEGRDGGTSGPTFWTCLAAIARSHLVRILENGQGLSLVKINNKLMVMSFDVDQV